MILFWLLHSFLDTECRIIVVLVLRVNVVSTTNNLPAK